MRFTLSSAVFSNRLITISKVLSSKNSIQILDCFLFEIQDGNLTITGSDNENELRCTLQLEESDSDGKFAISSKTILDAVKELPEQPITIEVDPTLYNVKLSYQNGDYNFTAQSGEDYPITQSTTEGAVSFEIPSAMLSETTARTIFATGIEELRPVMNGLYFEFGTEALAVVGSDGHKLVRNLLKTIKSEDPCSFILPKKAANILKSVLPHDDSNVKLTFDGKTALFVFEGGIMRCRLTEGRYPNYNSVIPQDNPCHLTVDRKAIVGSLRRVLPFASASSLLVRLRLSMGQIEVSADDIDFYTSAKESIVCDYSGSPMNIGFKGSSFLEVLNNLSSEEIYLELADPSRPCLVIPAEQPENQDILMLLMPMLLND